MPWIVSSSFHDSHNEKNVDKLLKPGATYKLARYGQDLNLPSKKLSKDRIITFETAPFPVDKVTDPSFRPTLTVHNTGPARKPIRRRHADQTDSNIPGDATSEIFDGDLLSIGGIAVVFRWEPLVCYSPRNSLFLSLSPACAQLGVHFVTSPGDPHITHNIQESPSADTASVCSLLCSAHFVTPAWLQELLRLGSLPRAQNPQNSPALLDNWKVPSTISYKPTLPSDYPKMSTWLPDETRINIFSQLRFICVGEKPRLLDGDTRSMLERGNGEVEVFNVLEGDTKFRKALSRAKGKSKYLVLLADRYAMRTAIGRDQWKAFEAHASEYEIPIASKEIVLSAVFSASRDILLHPPPEPEHMDESESLPSVIPNSMPDEPSQPPPTQTPPDPEPSPEPPTPPPRKKLTRRAVPSSKEPEPAPPLLSPLESAPEAEPARPRKALTRRVFATPATETPPAAADVMPLLSDSVEASVPRPSRLKRRVGVPHEEKPVPPEKPALRTLPTMVEDETKAKRLRMLYEATDPNNPTAHEDFDRIYDETQQSSGDSFPRPPAAKQRGPDRNLEVVREEEEETQASSRINGLAANRKRKASSMDDEGSSSFVEFKRRALEEARAVQESLERGVLAGAQPKAKTPAAQSMTTTDQGEATTHATTQARKFVSGGGGKKGSSGGAEPGKPDQDVAFLQALASQKKGKRKEDDFDREFNNLKIAKPPARTKRGGGTSGAVGGDGEDDPIVLADRQAREKERERQQLMDEEEDRWRILDDFDDAGMVTGNFMVVSLFEVDYEKRARDKVVETGEWQGRKNFKKFKRKQNGPGARVDTWQQNSTQYAAVAPKAKIPLVARTNTNPEYYSPIGTDAGYNLKEEIRIKEESDAGGDDDYESDGRMSVQLRSRSRSTPRTTSRVPAARPPPAALALPSSSTHTESSTQKKRKASGRVQGRGEDSDGYSEDVLGDENANIATTSTFTSPTPEPSRKKARSTPSSSTSRASSVAAPPPSRTRTTTSTSVATTKRTTQASTTRTKTRSTASKSQKTQPLFLDSDEDIAEVAEEMAVVDGTTGGSSMGGEGLSGGDSETLGTPSTQQLVKGTSQRLTGLRKNNLKRRTPDEAGDEEDGEGSDDDGVFRGFTRRTRARVG